MERCVYRIFVSGRVQGVCFRHNVSNFVKKRLKECRGYVKNLPDGRVEILILATEAELLTLEKFCQTSISLAEVKEFKFIEAQVDESSLGQSFIVSH